MKRVKILLALAVLFLCIPTVSKAQIYYYIGVGYPSMKGSKTFSNCLNARLGMGGRYLTGGVNFKSDLNRVINNVKDMDGAIYRLSLLGEINYIPIAHLELTLAGGYGMIGNYRTDITQTYYGVENVRSGIEAGIGGSLYLFYPHFSVNYLFTIMPGLGKMDPYFENTVGFTIRF